MNNLHFSDAKGPHHRVSPLFPFYFLHNFGFLSGALGILGFFLAKFDLTKKRRKRMMERQKRLREEQQKRMQEMQGI